VARTVDVRFEGDPFLFDIVQFCQRKDLKSAAVGQDWPMPVHKRVKAARHVHYFRTRAHPEVIGIAENDIGADRFQFFVGHRLHGGACADRHKNRRLKGTVRSRDYTAAGAALTADMF